MMEDWIGLLQCTCNCMVPLYVTLQCGHIVSHVALHIMSHFVLRAHG